MTTVTITDRIMMIKGRAGFNWCEALGYLLGPLSHCCEEKNGKRQSICENPKMTLWKYGR